MDQISPSSSATETKSNPADLRLLQALLGKFGILLVALVALMATAPLILSGSSGTVVLSIFAAVVLVSGLHAAQPGWKALAIGGLLAFCDFAIGRCTFLFHERWILLIQGILWLSTLFFVTSMILKAIFKQEEVTIETLCASLCVYLLIGLIGAFVYTLIELLLPGSYVSAHGSTVDWANEQSKSLEFMRLFVFSYSTLSGSSYPEISPGTGFASNVASLQAMTGQIYLAVVIARLVGLHSAPKTN